MLTQTEETTRDILAEIAYMSNFRSTDGLRFWDGYFLRRINRFSDLELHEFISNLCAAIGTFPNSPILVNTLEALSVEDEIEVMETIRRQPDLMAALAYSQIKRRQQK